MSAPGRIAPLGQTGSHTSQLMHSSVMIRATLPSVLGRLPRVPLRRRGPTADPRSGAGSPQRGGAGPVRLRGSSAGFVGAVGLLGSLAQFVWFGTRSWLILALSQASTDGNTNLLTSPPSSAISRTMLPEMNWYWSEGVRNIVSTSGSR